MRYLYHRGSPEFDRGLSFFDAVFGFALTLLVTTVDVSDPQSWTSVSALLESNGSQLLSFGISFVVIAAFWRQSYQTIGRITALDPVLVTTNLVLIGLVIFIPFTTEAMGDPELDHLPLPTALYAVNIAAAVLASLATYHLASRRGLLDEDIPRGQVRAELWDGLTTPAVFLLSIPVTYLGSAAWDSSTPGRLFWLLLLVIGPVSGRFAARATRRARAEAGLDEVGLKTQS